MKKIAFITFLLFNIAFVPLGNNFAETMFKDNFKDPNNWEYISDNVMGGVSSGKVEYQNNNAILSGNVSTENNGGFIQIRLNLEKVDLKNAKSIKLIAKGNEQKYFVHLRTTGTFLPWQYYQSEFSVAKEFKEFILPIENFKRSGSLMIRKVNPSKIKSIGLVAYGRDHKAELVIKEIGFTN